MSINLRLYHVYIYHLCFSKFSTAHVSLTQELEVCLVSLPLGLTGNSTKHVLFLAIYLIALGLPDHMVQASELLSSIAWTGCYVLFYLSAQSILTAIDVTWYMHQSNIHKCEISCLKNLIRCCVFHLWLEVQD